MQSLTIVPFLFSSFCLEKIVQPRSFLSVSEYSERKIVFVSVSNDLWFPAFFSHQTIIFIRYLQRLNANSTIIYSNLTWWTGHFLFAFVFSIKHRFTFHIEIFQFGQQTELKLNTKHINSHEFAYSNALWLNVKMSLTQHPHRFSWFSYFALKCQKSFSMEIDRETRCDSTTPLTCYRLDSHIRIHRNSINCLLITISTQFAFEFSDSVLLNEI